MGLKIRELVFITPTTMPPRSRNEYATQGVIMSKIEPDWYRVYMSWGDRTRIAEFPGHMLKKVEKVNKIVDCS